MTLLKESLIASLCSTMVCLGAGCTTGTSQTGPDADVASCVSTVVVPTLHPQETQLRDALAESDRLLCEAVRGHRSEVRAVISFSRLLRPDEVEALVRRHGLGVTMLEVKRGAERAQLPIEDASLAEVLAADRQRFDRWLAEETGFVQRLRRGHEEGERAAQDLVEIARIEGMLTRARGTGPLYSALAVTTSPATLPSLRLDLDIRYIVSAEMMDYAKGIDPESGEWR